jgi:formate--tetrahydrofolate ligase
MADLKPDAVIIVATVRALKYNGGVPKEEVTKPNLEALKVGICNLQKHIKNLLSYNIPVVVTINKYHTDIKEELEFIKNSINVPCAVCSSFAEGGTGALELAQVVLDNLNEQPDLKHPYKLDYDFIKENIKDLATKIYGAKDVEYSEVANEMLNKIEKMGYSNLPICIAKTQYSFSDDPKLLGAPEGFTLKVNEVRLSAGAGFIVVICGKIMTMPGLPKVPAANNISLNENNEIVGLF